MGRCQICGWRNHSSKFCKRRYKRNVNSPIANITTSTIFAGGSNWFPDTTASHDMTLDFTSLYISDNYKGSSTVIVGDGNGNGISIKHVGQSTLLGANSNPFKI